MYDEKAGPRKAI